MESRHVSRVIAVSPQDVYEFAVEPANLPRWASGLAEAEVEVRDDHLVVQSPMGEVRVRFVPRNSFGILDHDVTLPSGVTVTNPFRVLAHPDGAEVVFTVRQLDLSDEEFEQDARTIAKDLDALAALVES
ncbi:MULTISPECIES: SRPBCC family protein [Aeromicrobium]|uniref:SRPBCC family protein n=1 Tax=Aeromicrobium TaxID=2040 RepID=UPI00257F93CB|nr:MULTISPECIES: SRPBCC family protein [Aeromicrobium]